MNVLTVKPCPHCGEAEHLRTNVRESYVEDDKVQVAQVNCMQCYSRGPSHFSRDSASARMMAIDSWNKRR